jgi:hypothetical protein
MRHVAPLVLFVLVALTAACSDNTPSSTAPSSTTPTTPFYFTGTLAPQGSSFYSFTLTQAGTLGITVVSLATGPFSPTPATVVGIGYGVPVGSGCSLTASARTNAGLTAQLVTASGAGIFCVSIFDVGTLTAPTDFVIRIVHP